MPVLSALLRPLAFALLVTTLSCSSHRKVTNLEDLIARNTEAMGGRDAVEAVHSVAVDLHIVDPDFTADGIYYAARPGKMRIDIKADGRNVYTEAFDGKRGWQWKGRGDEVVAESSKATAALSHGVELPGHLYGLHEVRERGHQLELIGREEVDGIRYYALRLTMKDGYTTTLYLDPQSWFITRRRDFRPLHIDIDPTPTTIEQCMSDFRKVSGVTFSFANTETDLTTGKVLETTTAQAITVNPQIDPTRFEKL
ncbi:MAG: hypothetical protein ACR2HH_02180 [Chthoniobacterales bacterium]